MFIKDLGFMKDVPYFLPAVSNRNYARKERIWKERAEGRQGTGKGFGMLGLYHGVSRDGRSCGNDRQGGEVIAYWVFNDGTMYEK